MSKFGAIIPHIHITEIELDHIIQSLKVVGNKNLASKIENMFTDRNQVTIGNIWIYNEEKDRKL
jgi:hypothetical protein